MPQSPGRARKPVAAPDHEHEQRCVVAGQIRTNAGLVIGPCGNGGHGLALPTFPLDHCRAATGAAFPFSVARGQSENGPWPGAKRTARSDRDRRGCQAGEHHRATPQGSGCPSPRCGAGYQPLSVAMRIVRRRSVRAPSDDGTAKKGLPAGSPCCLARPKRFELLTSWFVARHSIQLSYGRERRDYREKRPLKQ